MGLSGFWLFMFKLKLLVLKHLIIKKKKRLILANQNSMAFKLPFFLLRVPKSIYKLNLLLGSQLYLFTFYLSFHLGNKCQVIQWVKGLVFTEFYFSTFKSTLNIFIPVKIMLFPHSKHYSLKKMGFPHFLSRICFFRCVLPHIRKYMDVISSSSLGMKTLCGKPVLGEVLTSSISTFY